MFIPKLKNLRIKKYICLSVKQHLQRPILVILKDIGLLLRKYIQLPTMRMPFTNDVDTLYEVVFIFVYGSHRRGIYMGTTYNGGFVA